jgi:hypothetical protein
MAPGEDAPNRGDAPVLVVAQGGHQHLQGSFGVHPGGGDARRMASNRGCRSGPSSGVSPARPVTALAYTVGKSACSSLAPSSMNRSKVWLRACSGSASFAVDLVDDHHGAVAHLEGLFEHEAGLRHGPLSRVHQQQHPVDHVHHPLDLAAEIGVPGCIDDIDLDLALDCRVPDRNGGVLGQDGDAALALQVVRIHHSLGHLLVLTEGVRLAQQSIHQGGLAVVDVGDDGNIAQVGSFNNHSLAIPSAAPQAQCSIRPG